MTESPSAVTEAEVGYLESLRVPNHLARVRLEAVYLTLSPLALWVVVPFLPGAGEPPTLWALLLPVLAGVAAFLAEPRVLGHLVQPLPADIPADEAGPRSLEALRRVSVVRVAVSGAPIFAGLLLVPVGTGVLPYAVGFLVGWPLMLRACPSTVRIEEVRRRLESAGAGSRIWTALATRVHPVT